MVPGKPTPETPILRVTDVVAGYHEYIGPFQSRKAALDAARAVRRLVGYDRSRFYQIDNGDGAYPEDVQWTMRQDEHWPVFSEYTPPSKEGRHAPTGAHRG